MPGGQADYRLGPTEAWLRRCGVSRPVQTPEAHGAVGGAGGVGTGDKGRGPGIGFHEA